MITESELRVDQQVRVKYEGNMVTAVYKGWHHQYDLAIVEFDGRKLYRKVFEIVRSGTAAKPVTEKPKSRFTIGQRFSFIETLVDMVVSGSSKSVIITGSGGLGKTYTVMERLKKAGLGDVDDEDVEDGDYQIIKGFTTPKSLYRLLYNNRDRIVIFDDCDSVWDNVVAVSLLKAALDSYETRRISWMTEIRNDDDDLPQSFLFTGKVIFVSNLQLNQLDQAVLSRCLYVDVSMTAAEKIERIRAISPNIRKDLGRPMHDDALALLEKFKDQIGDLNIRTYLQVLDIRAGDKTDWKDIAEYVVTAI